MQSELMASLDPTVRSVMAMVAYSLYISLIANVDGWVLATH